MGAAVDFNDFKLKYPELVSAGDANQVGIEGCIAESYIILGTPPCPKLADNLVLALSAHCVAKSGYNPEGADSSPSIANSKSVGSVSISYSIPTSFTDAGTMKAYYGSTSYGMNYLVLQRYCFGAGIITAP